MTAIPPIMPQARCSATRRLPLYGDNANEMVVFLDNHAREPFLTEAGGNVEKLQKCADLLVYCARRPRRIPGDRTKPRKYVSRPLGANIYIVGSVAELGNWSTDMAEGPALARATPAWTVFINVPAEQMIEWEALKKATQHGYHLAERSE